MPPHQLTDEELMASTTPSEIEAANIGRVRALSLFDRDTELLERSLSLLHRFATEQTGWRGFFRRWYYSDEPLRNDAANLVREARFGIACMPRGTRLVGGQH